MQTLQTIIVILPIVVMFIQNEKRLSRIETNIEWIIKKLNGAKP